MSSYGGDHMSSLRLAVISKPAVRQAIPTVSSTPDDTSQHLQAPPVYQSQSDQRRRTSHVLPLALMDAAPLNTAQIMQRSSAM